MVVHISYHHQMPLMRSCDALPATSFKMRAEGEVWLAAEKNMPLTFSALLGASLRLLCLIGMKSKSLEWPLVKDVKMSPVYYELSVIRTLSKTRISVAWLHKQELKSAKVLSPLYLAFCQQHLEYVFCFFNHPKGFHEANLCIWMVAKFYNQDSQRFWSPSTLLATSALCSKMACLACAHRLQHKQELMIHVFGEPCSTPGSRAATCTKHIAFSLTGRRDDEWRDKRKNKHHGRAKGRRGRWSVLACENVAFCHHEIALSETDERRGKMVEKES